MRSRGRGCRAPSIHADRSSVTSCSVSTGAGFLGRQYAYSARTSCRCRCRHCRGPSAGRDGDSRLMGPMDTRCSSLTRSLLRPARRRICLCLPSPMVTLTTVSHPWCGGYLDGWERVQGKVRTKASKTGAVRSASLSCGGRVTDTGRTGMRPLHQGPARGNA
jgi:hypothetical protein